MEPKDVVNVLRDTHAALVPGGELVDFHPRWPPWARVEWRGETLGELEEPDFPEQLRATEAGMDEAVRIGLFRHVTERTHDIHEYYDDADELIEEWSEHTTPELEERLRATRGVVHVVERVVFRLYRAVE
jgi:hypothetical protein